MKLGVRGLIDAYGGTAAKGLELAGRVERVMTRAVCVSMGYEAVGNVTRLLEAAGSVSTRWTYGESVKVVCDVPVNMFDYFSRELEELKARKIITLWEELSS